MCAGSKNMSYIWATDMFKQIILNYQNGAKTLILSRCNNDFLLFHLSKVWQELIND